MIAVERPYFGEVKTPAQCQQEKLFAIKGDHKIE